MPQRASALAYCTENPNRLNHLADVPAGETTDRRSDPTTRMALLPSAPKVPHTSTVHGEVRGDEYAWLRDKKSSDVA